MLFAVLLLGDSVNNPALNPVKFQSPPSHQPLRLVVDGKANLAIAADLESEKSLPPVRRSVTNAVDVLREAFRRCAGIELPVVKPDNQKELANYQYVIAVGTNRITDGLGMKPGQLPKEGLEVMTFPNGIAIAGYDGSQIPGSYDRYDWSRYRLNGTQNGAYDFVERFLGVRYYFPGIGTIWPKITNLSIEPVHYTDAPYFHNRFTHLMLVAMQPQNHYQEFGPYENADFEGRWRITLGSRYWAGHGPPISSWRVAHPELKEMMFYRDPGGHQYYDELQHIGNYMDVSNLELADLFVKDLHHFFDTEGKWNATWKGSAEPNSEYVIFGNCDTFVSGMDNAVIRDLKLIPPSRCGDRDGELSDVYARFHIALAEKLKKEFPGMRLSIMPYHNYVLPPLLSQYRKFPDNVDVRICIYDFPRFTRNPATVEKWRNILKEWRQVLGGHPISSLWLYNEPSNLFGRAVVGRYVADLPKILGPELGREELFLDDYGGFDWEYYYTSYVAYRSMWNPDFNIDAALDEQWKLLYGNAAPYVKEFYDLLVERWEKIMAQKEKDKRKRSLVFKLLSFVFYLKQCIQNRISV